MVPRLKASIRLATSAGLSPGSGGSGSVTLKYDARNLSGPFYAVLMDGAGANEAA
jgi:hypothetical protein